MQYPSKRLSRVLEEGLVVTNWLKRKTYNIDEKVSSISGPVLGARVAMIVSAIIGGIIDLVIAGNTIWNPFQISAFPMIGWVILAASAILLVGSIYWTTKVQPAKKSLRRAKRAELERELNTHPLTQRAKLIANALLSYERRLGLYRELFERVDEGLLDEPEENVTRAQWLALEQANSILTQATQNFSRAADLNARDEDFRREKVPEEDERGDALVLLLEELDTPLELPPELSLDPSEAIKDNALLLKAFHELDLDGDALAEEIDAFEPPPADIPASDR